MEIYKIECEWEMPYASGYFATPELAEEAIQQEDEWEHVNDWPTGTTKQQMIDILKEDGMLQIITINVITK
jgi:hypothetical protein